MIGGWFMFFGIVFVVGVVLGVVSNVLGVFEGPFQRRLFSDVGVVGRFVVRVGSGSGCVCFIAHIDSWFFNKFFGNRSIVTHFSTFGFSGGSIEGASSGAFSGWASSGWASSR